MAAAAGPSHRPTLDRPAPHRYGRRARGGAGPPGPRDGCRRPDRRLGNGRRPRHLRRDRVAALDRGVVQAAHPALRRGRRRPWPADLSRDIGVADRAPRDAATGTVRCPGFIGDPDPRGTSSAIYAYRSAAFYLPDKAWPVRGLARRAAARRTLAGVAGPCSTHRWSAATSARPQQRCGWTLWSSAQARTCRADLGRGCRFSCDRSNSGPRPKQPRRHGEGRSPCSRDALVIGGSFSVVLPDGRLLENGLVVSRDPAKRRGNGSRTPAAGHRRCSSAPAGNRRRLRRRSWLGGEPNYAHCLMQWLMRLPSLKALAELPVLIAADLPASIRQVPPGAWASRTSASSRCRRTRRSGSVVSIVPRPRPADLPSTPCRPSMSAGCVSRCSGRIAARRGRHAARTYHAAGRRRRRLVNEAGDLGAPAPPRLRRRGSVPIAVLRSGAAVPRRRA